MVTVVKKNVKDEKVDSKSAERFQWGDGDLTFISRKTGKPIPFDEWIAEGKDEEDEEDNV